MATIFADAAYNDGGVVYGPGGVLFLARWPVNQLGQTKPGSVITDKIISLGAFGVVGGGPGGVMFVPPGFPGAGQLKILTWSSGFWYTLGIAPDGAGTLDVTSATHETTIGGGPEGMIYIPPGSPVFGGLGLQLLVAEWSAGNVVAYAIDANGDPIPATRTVFLSGLSGAEGAEIDPITGDFLFSTFGGGDRVFICQGFVPPPQIEIFDDQPTFESATGASPLTIPGPSTLAVHPAFGDPGAGCDVSISIPFGANTVTVTAPLAIPPDLICIFDATVVVPPSNTDPHPIAPTIVGNGEDDYLVEFDIPVFEVGFELLTNFSAVETITLKDAGGVTIGVISVDSLTSPNTFQFVGFTSAVGIKSVFIDTTDGGTQNEGISAIKVVQPAPTGDTTPPRCEVIGVNIAHAAPPTNLLVEVEDTGSGLDAINGLVSTNAVVNIPAFTVGTNAVVQVVADKIDESKRSRVEIQAIDVAGNSSTCDPVLATLTSGSPTLSVRDIRLAERYLTLIPSDPSGSTVMVNVNGRWFRAGVGHESVTIDLGSAMANGSDNTVTLWASSDTTILLADAVPKHATISAAVRPWWHSAWSQAPVVAGR